MLKKISLYLLVSSLLLILWLYHDTPNTTIKVDNYYPENLNRCKPIDKIGFLKTHKCASTSVQNIFLRHGLKMKSNFVFPLTGHYLSKERKFTREILTGTPWEAADMDYDIFCLHTVWNFDAVSDLLGPGAKYITIVREPISLFRSLWDYLGYAKAHNMTLDEFALLPDEKKKRIKLFMGRNTMLHDMGLPKRLVNHQEVIKNKIKEIDNTFDLVMVAEHFDESMVLMKDLLCWEYEDVANLKLNSHKEASKSEISEEGRLKLENWLKGDVMVYNHFNRKFQDVLKKYEKNMTRELINYRRVNELLKENCVLNTVEDSHTLADKNFKLWAKDMVGYELKEECKYHGMNEVRFVDILRKQQTIRARKLNRNFVTQPSELDQFNRAIRNKMFNRLNSN